MPLARELRREFGGMRAGEARGIEALAAPADRVGDGRAAKRQKAMPARRLLCDAGRLCFGDSPWTKKKRLAITASPGPAMPAPRAL